VLRSPHVAVANAAEAPPAMTNAPAMLQSARVLQLLIEFSLGVFIVAPCARTPVTPSFVSCAPLRARSTSKAGAGKRADGCVAARWIRAGCDDRVSGERHFSSGSEHRGDVADP
jgi:hypothetical protein